MKIGVIGSYDPKKKVCTSGENLKALANISTSLVFSGAVLICMVAWFLDLDCSLRLGNHFVVREDFFFFKQTSLTV